MLRQDWNDEDLGLSASSYTVAGVLSWAAFDGGVTTPLWAGPRPSVRTGCQAAPSRGWCRLQVSESRRRSQEAEERVAARGWPWNRPPRPSVW
jgi:hypothetical protein